MGDPEASPMEEDESGVEVRHAFECDLGVCGGRFNIDHTHTPECLAFTSGREKASTNSAQGGLLAEGQKEAASHGVLVVRERGDCSRVKLCSSKFRAGSRSCVRDDDARSGSRRDKQDLGRSFQLAVSAHDWLLAESFIPLADSQRLNDGLCIALDSVWFLSTTQELAAATRLIERLISAGASDFTRAALRTSFLASCVSACRSRTMSLADTVTVMAQR